MMYGWFSEQFGHSNQCTAPNAQAISTGPGIYWRMQDVNMFRRSQVFKTSFLKMRIQVEEFGEESDMI